MPAYLLDTNIALFATGASARLTPAARKAILSGDNALSILSYWEVVIKSMKGALDVGDPRIWWSNALEQLSAIALPVRPNHVAGVLSLPPLHKDPFDRLLIAQAIAEGFTLITADAEIARYANSDLAVIL